MMSDDMALLREYARNNSEASFATLVSRYVNLVYSVALRQVGDPHLAEEITQAVFIILARKAAQLSPHTVLSGWLCRAARYTSANALTIQRRRQHREQEAYMQSPLNEPESEAWTHIAPLLEEALEQLGRKDHDAVVLRFLEGRSLSEVGAALGASEDAAKKRVNRALERLRKFFMSRGVTSTTALIAGVISAHSVHAAPATLAQSVAAVAIAKGVTASVSTSTLIQGALKIMAWTKAKTAIVAGAVVLLAVGTTTITVTEIRRHSPYPWQVENADMRTMNRVPPQVKIVPTLFSPREGWNESNGKMIGMGQSISNLLGLLSPAGRSFDKYRRIVATPLPEGNYDFIANLPEGNREALRREIERQFQLVGRTETRETDVLLLTLRNRNARGLKPSAAKSEHSSLSNGASFYKGDNVPFTDFAMFLEFYFETPVLDRTGIGSRFNFDLKWDGPAGHGPAEWQHRDREALKQLLLDQLGLELVPSREPVEMLVVEKSK